MERLGRIRPSNDRNYSIMLILWISLTTILLVQEFWAYTYSLSFDYGTHNSWIRSIVENGKIDLGYPPLSYWLGAVLAVFVGNATVAQNVVIIITLNISIVLLIYIVQRSGMLSALLFVAVIGFIYFRWRSFPFVGYEIIENYFYSQFVSTMYMLVGFAFFMAWPYSRESRIVFSLFFIALGFYIYPIPILIFFSATIIQDFLELSKNAYRKIALLIMYIVAGFAIFVLNPSTGTIIKVAGNNGGLFFPLLTESPLDLSRFGIGFLVFSFLFSTMLFIFDLRFYRRGNERHAAALVNSVLLSASSVSLVQYLLYVMGISNPYSVKKYFFIIGTFIAMDLCIRFSMALVTIVAPKGSSHGSVLSRSSQILPMAAPILVLLLLHRGGTDIRTMLEIEKEIPAYRSSNASSNIETFARFNLPNTINFLISVSDLGVPRDSAYAFYKRKDGNETSWQPGVILTEKRHGTTNPVWLGKSIIAINAVDWAALTTGIPELGKNIFFSDKISKAYLYQGFYDQEHWGVWAEGYQSVLLLTMRKRADTALKFLVSPFLPKEGMALRVDIYANGTMIDAWEFSHGQEFPTSKSILVPGKLVAGNGRLELMFKYNSMNSPNDLGLSKDTRKLSLGFISMEVE